MINDKKLMVVAYSETYDLKQYLMEINLLIHPNMITMPTFLKNDESHSFIMLLFSFKFIYKKINI